MGRKLRAVSGRDAVKAFSKLGYLVLRQHGSHIRLGHRTGDKKKKLTIPDHKELGRGLLRKLIRDAEITVEAFNELLE